APARAGASDRKGGPLRRGDLTGRALAPSRRLPAPLLRPRRRARSRAPVPATGRGDRALGPGCADTRHRLRRRGDRQVERNLGRTASEDRAPAPGRDRSDRALARRGHAHPRGGEARVSEPWWISLIKSFVVINLVMVAFAYTTLLERKLL